MKAAMAAKNKRASSSLKALAWAALALGFMTFAYSGAFAKGPLSHHMIAHIALMNLIAPGVALLAVRGAAEAHQGQPTMILAATLTQLFLFLFWHAPPGMAEGAAAALLMHASLGAAALWFWREILRERRERPWIAVAALAVTGKIICLMAALYVFAPRVLYRMQIESALADQHLAGLLMLTACPLVYLGAALLITIAAFDRYAASRDAA